MAKLIMSAFADEYSDVLTEQLEALNGFGINFIELRHADGKGVAEMTGSDVKEIKKKLLDYGVGVSAIGSPLGKVKLDGDLDAHFDTARRIFNMANELGTKHIRMFSYYPPEGKSIYDFKDEVYFNMEKLIKIAEEYGMVLCLENEDRLYGACPKTCLELCEAFKGRLKVVFDMGNFALKGVETYPYAYNLLREHIEYFHIKDAYFDAETGKGSVVPAGCGNAKIKEILTDFAKTSNFDTFISLEPHLLDFGGLAALGGKHFDSPFVYKDKKEAFADGVKHLKELLAK